MVRYFLVVYVKALSSESIKFSESTSDYFELWMCAEAAYIYVYIYIQAYSGVQSTQSITIFFAHFRR